jgi:hypothetical protein
LAIEEILLLPWAISGVERFRRLVVGSPAGLKFAERTIARHFVRWRETTVTCYSFATKGHFAEMANRQSTNRFGIDPAILKTIDWELATRRVLVDVRSDFIYAPAQHPGSASLAFGHGIKKGRITTGWF